MQRPGILAVAVAALVACAPVDRAPSRTTVLFLSDFGEKDGAVAVCKGVIWSIEPGAHVIDLTHEVPPYDVETAAEVLEQALPFYPSGTVALAIVDPGVGGQRKAAAILTKKGHLLVGPDNGIFTLVLETEGLERAVELRNTRYFRPGETVFTFHGRDIFAPVAAHLAAGVPLDSLGPPLEPVRLRLPRARRTAGRVEGIVRYVEDPYGNVVTNIPSALIDSIADLGDTLEVRLGARTLRLPWHRTFSDAPRGAPLALLHSRGFLSFSIHQGDFATAYRVRRRDAVSVHRAR